MNGGCHRVPGAGSSSLTFCSLRKMCSCVLSCCLALQHLTVQASLLCIFHLLLLPTLPEEQPQAVSELLARSLFACGISTILQTCMGSRLPLVQIPSFEYLVPAMMLSSHLSLSASTDRNGTVAASVCPAPHCDVAGSRTASLREVSGAVVVSGLVQLVLGVSGACGWTARRCGPMVLAPSLSIVGLSAYKEVLLPFTGICIMCAILSHLRIPWDSLELATERLPWANSTVRSPWLRIPYPGEGGWPLLTPRALAVGTAMAVGGSVNSVGCYVLCGRLLRASRPPPEACNRGLCTEALGSLLAGLLGATGGTASSIANTCASSLTQAGSRLSVQVSALVCVALGMSPRLAGLLTHIPLVVHGGVLCVTYAVAVGTGISYFQYADIDSGRNIFIVGFTMFMALLVPRWLSTAPAHLATGWVPLDLLFLSLLMVPVFLTGFLSFFLENTVSGTLEERGLLADLVARRGDRCPRGERGDSSHVYRLPAGLRRLLPPSGCKAFPCCFLCPGCEEEEEEQGSCATQEGTASTGEGTHLLLKAGMVEMQSERRLSEMEMPAWHVAA
ncbi:solute carrier family 23 member 3 isoform X2 [Dromaius novaehollandiae]|uniref:solute carrier family 23 member 3 isoform X2 n=1 Tax=Dromaius novaehollandiae TaxID=8790 RepID=UPI00311F871A